MVTAVRALELKIPPGVVALVFGAAMWGIASSVTGFDYQLAGREFWAAGLMVAGVVLAAAAIGKFRQARTTWNPMKPELASALVTTGIYSHSRNPMYLAVLLLLMGWACFLGNALAWLVLPGLVGYLNRFQIAPEERALTALYGREYEDYRMRVRRWL